ncbi:MAG: sulfatase [Spirochaetota bacterium]
MKPHIVQIIFHDLGQTLACYGKNSRPTPNIDAVASEGVQLERMFCAAPQCSPSRAAIMTGRYPHANGMLGLAHIGWAYHEGERTMASLVRDHGYRSVLLGHQHESGIRGDRAALAAALGYDEVAPVPSPHYASYITPAVCDYIGSKIDPATPHFLSIGFFDVHRPNYGEPTEAHMASVALPDYVPDTPEARRDFAQLELMAEEADGYVGRILESLQKVLPKEETLLFITTDHGPELNRAKMTLYDPGLLVTSIFSWPGKLAAGARLAGMYGNIDILPTVLELADVPVPANLHGTSFAGDLRSGSGAGREEVFAEKTSHSYVDPMRCVRTPTHKYIRNYAPGLPMQISSQHCVHLGIDRIEAEYGRPRPAEELYDLVNDPGERVNLAGQPAVMSIQEELSRRLRAELTRTDDPVHLGRELSIPERVNQKRQWVYDEPTQRYRLEIANAESWDFEHTAKRPMQDEE